ncbi:hypothetical protein C8Q77DRAFT_262050 [Trametes polyzona]|nr:hypothetical protein C8Q77DRAFT_262050 [Trametes polyzona]
MKLPTSLGSPGREDLSGCSMPTLHVSGAPLSSCIRWRSTTPSGAAKHQSLPPCTRATSTDCWARIKDEQGRQPLSTQLQVCRQLECSRSRLVERPQDLRRLYDDSSARRALPDSPWCGRTCCCATQNHIAWGARARMAQGPQRRLETTTVHCLLRRPSMLVARVYKTALRHRCLGLGLHCDFGTAQRILATGHRDDLCELPRESSRRWWRRGRGEKRTSDGPASARILRPRLGRPRTSPPSPIQHHGLCESPRAQGTVHCMSVGGNLNTGRRRTWEERSVRG